MTQTDSSNQHNAPHRTRPLILASSSPYRKMLLERLNISFSIDIPAIDESPLAQESPLALALRLALEKARAVAIRHPNALVIGSDQVAVLQRTDQQQPILLGKPGNFENALHQLHSMQGQTVIFHSALCLFDARHHTHQIRNVPTSVRFRTLADHELIRYLEIEQPFDCAGSAKVEGLGISLLESVESTDPTALIGLPLIALTDMLRQAAYPLLGPLVDPSLTPIAL